MAGERVVDFFTTQPVRVSALLRLPLIGLIVVLVSVWDVDHWLPVLYAVILSVYAAAAVLWLVVVFRGPMPPWAEWASTAVDVLVLVALCAVSGGATAALLPVFFLLPISVAFQDRPWLTALLGGSTALGYLAVWILYSERDDNVGLPDIVYMHVGFLAWLAVASAALSFVLARRSARVRTLMEVRRQLVSESTRADDLRNAELAEHLHDGPLQTLLAARLDLDEIRERIPDPGLDRVHAALQETAAGLRSTVTALHPQVLAQLGLTPAVRELLRQYENRPEITVRAELEDVGQPEGQALLYRAARELLANVNKHAGATTISVGLYRSGNRVVLTVADNGTGFDTSLGARAVAEGHIGLASLQVRIDAMGGSMAISSEPGFGTQVRVTL
ncbi:sensor histidine kinase [Mycolicibacterium fortuitum]|jgi:two-component system NarL family sensor kinase|uniref:ATP-binding protein n=2 Tax=Mycolicibacterium fortuitum TaxID=1766 RepID=A0AAE4VAH7_MYCFO|nr:ATP-binding protein [Mycolicibacterium fortuitum]MCV7141707.1 sensor histidine kinase [Mycolicibacterium fortuitum]MDV7191687.1 ATP-binding protein [Mycolicibacterium fortuitum]MDV7204362.1 ATP-binding protein [Mycolicibacterium fortuitum]MDV7225883.1 ATP-binding protein [Mycolicibacterium fortuitum]MDV7257288.1 ATP-binding protein [Mycolicibacterium fortuitum]